MNTPLPDDWLDRYADGELPPELRAWAEQQLELDPEGRDLDLQLRQLLKPPVLDESAFLVLLETPAALPVVRGRSAAWGGPLVLLAVIAALVLAVITLNSETNAQAGIATLVRATGPVELRTTEQSTWRTIPAPRDVRLAAGTHLRTLDQSLCEVVTASQGTVRVNQRTEIKVIRPDEVELVSGQFWCRASSRAAIRVCVPSSESMPVAPLPTMTPSLSVFTCPSASETDWKVEDASARCISVADQPTELCSSANQSWTIDPGFSLACSPGEEPDLSRQFDRLQTTSWQLPLLNQRAPDDPELQGMLQSLLATIGMSKMGGFYDSEIRALGPSGTIPLIAYVRSPISQTDPARRQRAMQIIADLAPGSVLSDLERLKQDTDPQVSQLASAAIARLQSTP